jgi:hypothetical protein
LEAALRRASSAAIEKVREKAARAAQYKDI